MLNSYEIKTLVCEYARYNRMWLCATECQTIGGCIADVLIDTGKDIIEVEVKVSIGDLKAEAKKGGYWKKHDLLQKGGYSNTPNKFYFAIPQELELKAKPIVEEMFPHCGLIVAGAVMYFSIPSKRLHTNRNEHLKEAIINRAISEMVQLRRKLQKLKPEKEKHIQYDIHNETLPLFEGVV